MNRSEYWIGKDIDYASIWRAFDEGQDYIDKFRSMRVHLLRIELSQYPASFPLFNHEAVYKTLKGFFHDFKLLTLSQREYDAAGPLFLYSVDRNSGIWNFLGEPRQIIAFAARLVAAKNFGKELHNLASKLEMLERQFPGEVDPAEVQKFITVKLPKPLDTAVARLVAEGIQTIGVSKKPFEGSLPETEKSLFDINIFLVKGDLVMGDNVGRDNIHADRGGVAAGGNAEINNFVFMQAWSELSAKPDLDALSRELADLRKKMRAEAVEAQHDIAIGEIAAAETAANFGDGASVMQHLKAAGKWALEFAIQVGATLTAEIMKKAIEL